MSIGTLKAHIFVEIQNVCTCAEACTFWGKTWEDPNLSPMNKPEALYKQGMRAKEEMWAAGNGTCAPLYTDIPSAKAGRIIG